MARSRLFVLAVLAALAVGVPAEGQYVIQKVGRADGDLSGATVAGDELDNVSKPSVSSNGLVAFQGDTTLTTDDDVIYLGNDLIVESGTVAVGTGGEFDTLDIFQTWLQVNANGDIAFTSTLQNVLPDSTLDHGLHVNNTLIFQEGTQAPGLPDVRLFADFGYPAILNDGRVAFRADLDGSTTDDMVIYFDGLPLPMNATSIFREGQLIIGGPLDGETFGTVAFNEIDWNNNGDVIIDGDLEGDTTTDDVLFIKRPGLDYEVAIRAGDMITAPTGTFAYESTDDVRINDNGDWVIDAIIDTATTEDNVVIASIGGGAPEVILQEDGDASLLTGVPLTQFGIINGVAINDNGDIAILVNIDDDPSNPIPYVEAIVLYSAGTLSLVTTDEVAIPNGMLTDIAGSSVALANDGAVIFEATVDGLDGIYRATIPNVIPVQNVACDHVSGTTDVNVTWDLGQVYTGIRVVVDGVPQVPDLLGTAIDTTVTGLAGNLVHEICIIGLDGIDESPEFCCSTGVPEIPDVVLCSAPGTPILDSTVITDTITVPNAINIADMYVEVNITHSFQADLDPLSITSPMGTTVILMMDDGGGDDNVHTFFTDFGAASDSVPYQSGLFVQPSIGTLADFHCEPAMGDWILTVGDDAS
ncbi:MAG: proprotein convertase P-domain-containing protein, partial [Planctomycetes bacterium]|nr:proprotein convertase P-domain-containing protein [Planctomycetota bacterium]